MHDMTRISHASLQYSAEVVNVMYLKLFLAIRR